MKAMFHGHCASDWGSTSRCVNVRNRRSRWRRAGALACLLMLGAVHCASAKTDPRLTGAAVVDRLAQAQQGLAERTKKQPALDLAETGKRLATISDGLHKALGDNAAKPIAKMSDDTQALALRADAAARQTAAYLKASAGCSDGTAIASAKALAAGIKLLASAPASSHADQPVIDTIETKDHRPVFAIHAGGEAASIILTGVNLADPKCDSPPVSATDDAGKLLDAQPKVIRALPGRIELKLPGDLAAGDYVLHVVPEHKRWLIGCGALPEATAVLRVIAPLKITVRYSVVQNCKAGGKSAPVTGTLPELTKYGATVSQRVALPACNDPLDYTVAATATFPDGSKHALGPISQGAAVGITAGWRGGLTFNWNPSIETVLVRSVQNSCKSVY